LLITKYLIMRRKKQKSKTGTQLELFSRQERRKRKCFFKWFCELWTKDKGKAEQIVKDDYHLFI